MTSSLGKLQKFHFVCQGSERENTRFFLPWTLCILIYRTPVSMAISQPFFNGIFYSLCLYTHAGVSVTPSHEFEVKQNHCYPHKYHR